MLQRYKNYLISHAFLKIKAYFLTKNNINAIFFVNLQKKMSTYDSQHTIKKRVHPNYQLSTFYLKRAPHQAERGLVILVEFSDKSFSKVRQNFDDLLKNMGGLGNLGNLGMPDLSQLSAIVPILQAFNSQDERLDFINALKPLLSEERQKKADEATKLVKLMSVLPLLRERGIM